MRLLKSCSLIYECGIKLVYKRLKDFSLHLFCVVNINWQQNWRSFIFISGQISRTETWSNLEVKSWKDRIVFVFFFPVVTSKIIFVLDPWLFADSWYNSSNSVIDVIDLIPGLPGDLTINRDWYVVMTLALRFFNLKVVETNAERAHDFPFSLSFPRNTFEEKVWRYHQTSF